ncbi:hypothetical protein ES705_07269 [subsurface metagenome]
MVDRIEVGFFTYLTTHAGLSALIGTRLWPLRLPQNVEYPCIRYRQVSNPPELAHDGPVGLGHPRYQFDCYSPLHDEAWQVAQQLEFALHGFRGAMGTVTVQAGIVQDTREDYDAVIEAYRVMLDAILWHDKEVS